jgi:hypothetical protein
MHAIAWPDQRPELGQARRPSLSFCRVVDADQLQVGVAEEEAAAGRALAGVGWVSGAPDDLIIGAARSSFCSDDCGKSHF